MTPSDARRLLILAEGFSGDPHYGKTMRGVLRYRREDVVVILDSTRAGETHDGVPIVATIGEALPFAPTAALVGVATQGGRFPPARRSTASRFATCGAHPRGSTCPRARTSRFRGRSSSPSAPTARSAR